MVVGLLIYLVGDCIEVCLVGIEFVGQVNLMVVVVMVEMGIDIIVNVFILFIGGQVQFSDVVIMMGCGDVCFYFLGVFYCNWKLFDFVGQFFDVVCMICDDIVDCV